MTFVRIKGMGRAGKVLKTVMENHGISQGRLAAVMGIGASNIYRWANEVRDPSSETVVSLIKALKQVQPEAADEFKALYLKDL
ncbi:helix-turn-helix transcriptional regulator [Leptothoe sp. EHU-05/26/07-4]